MAGNEGQCIFDVDKGFGKNQQRETVYQMGYRCLIASC